VFGLVSAAAIPKWKYLEFDEKKSVCGK